MGMKEDEGNIITKEQVLKDLESILKEDESWMNKYKTLEAVPEDGDELVTEGRIEVLEHAIKKIKTIGLKG